MGTYELHWEHGGNTKIQNKSTPPTPPQKKGKLGPPGAC